ncbi:MAG TPA: hypothetical protein VGH89_41600 [Pseudonocardia sp.]
MRGSIGDTHAFSGSMGWDIPQGHALGALNEGPLNDQEARPIRAPSDLGARPTVASGEHLHLETIFNIELRQVSPPGSYGDGPVSVRVNRRHAGPSWPVPLFRGSVDQFRFRLDNEHDYVEADNSHSAFVYQRWMQDDGVPASAVSVVRVIR